MTQWKHLKNPSGNGNVRYREHATRKHGIMPDRCYFIRYRREGKRYDESVGWASSGVTPAICFQILAELDNNHRQGSGPVTLAEKRAIATAEKEAQQRREAAEEKRTFKAFFDDIYLPNVISRESPKDNWKKNANAVKDEQHVRTWLNPVVGRISFDKIGENRILSIIVLLQPLLMLLQ